MKSLVLGLALACGLLSAPAQAEELISTGGVFCDTKEQAKQFVSLWDGKSDPEPSMQIVNQEAGKDDACILVQVELSIDKRYERIHAASGDWQIIEVTLHSILSPMGWLEMEPLKQFSAQSVEEPELEEEEA